MPYCGPHRSGGVVKTWVEVQNPYPAIRSTRDNCPALHLSTTPFILFLSFLYILKYLKTSINHADFQRYNFCHRFYRNPESLVEISSLTLAELATKESNAYTRKIKASAVDFSVSDHEWLSKYVLFLFPLTLEDKINLI